MKLEDGPRPEGAEPHIPDAAEKAVPTPVSNPRRELLSSEIKAERRSDPEYRQEVDDARRILNGYADFVREVKGSLEYMRSLEINDPNWQSQMENLEQVAMGWKDSLAEVMSAVKGRTPLPFHVEKLAHTIQACLLELEGAKFGELFGQEKDQVISALEEFVGANAALSVETSEE